MPSKKLKKRKNISSPIDPQSIKGKRIDYPIFCFKHLKLTFNREYKYYYKFIERIQKLSTLSWNQINRESKHGYGFEKMPLNQIRKDMPPFITPDVQHLQVFRATGDNRVFLGLRKENIFHVIFMEEQFGDIYNHGSK
ncbi:hypothetical protein GCM10009117_08920 [Gangjinia marincola]|uniref:Uncharacterized protein n=2 Tax=Gangjinia marincola TaxID=578463 RepID=A0ABP3XUR6_9FLAO